MKNLLFTIAMLCCSATTAYAVDWQDTSSTDYGLSRSTKTDLGGHFYRIKKDGSILRKQSGTTHYYRLRNGIEDVPVAHRVAVAREFDRYVGTHEEPTGGSGSGTRTRTSTTDRSSRTHTRTDSRSHDRHDTYDRHDRYDSSDRGDHRQIDRSDQRDHSDRRTYRRDEDVRYSARIGGSSSYSPVIVQANNFRSSVSVDFRPVDSRVTMSVLNRHADVVQQLIASEHRGAQYQADLRVEQAKPPRVEIRTVRVKSHCDHHHCSPVCLEAKCWVCGRQFKDQYNRTWNLLSGPRMSHKPRNVRGCLGQLADGRLTITVKWCGHTTVYVDP